MGWKGTGKALDFNEVGEVARFFIQSSPVFSCLFHPQPGFGFTHAFAIGSSLCSIRCPLLAGQEPGCPAFFHRSLPGLANGDGAGEWPIHQTS